MIELKGYIIIDKKSKDFILYELFITKKDALYNMMMTAKDIGEDGKAWEVVKGKLVRAK